jgi:hypothetical protein
VVAAVGQSTQAAAARKATVGLEEEEAAVRFRVLEAMERPTVVAVVAAQEIKA